MRKHSGWRAVPALIVLTLVAAACGSSSNKTSSGQSSTSAPGTTVPQFAAGTTMAALQAKGKIVVGTKFDQPGLGLKKGDTAFRNFINDRLEAIYANGAWASAFTATLGKFGIPTPTPPAVNRYS